LVYILFDLDASPLIAFSVALDGTSV